MGMNQWVKQRMAGRMDGWRHGLMDAWTEGQFNECMYGAMDGGMKERTD